MRELRATDKSDIVELAVTMQTGVCPFIVGFYGCLIRDVSLQGLELGLGMSSGMWVCKG